MHIYFSFSLILCVKRHVKLDPSSDLTHHEHVNKMLGKCDINFMCILDINVTISIFFDNSFYDMPGNIFAL